MKFLLGDCVTFNSDDGSLYHIEQQDNIIVLPHLASRVLTCLVVNAGQVVSRETIFDYVWANNELIPSNNSLTQYVSLIRKTLLELKCQNELIETIPKRGFYFPAQYVNPITEAGSVAVRKYPVKDAYLLVCLAILIIISLCIFFFRATAVENDLEYTELFALGDIASCKVYTVNKVSSHNIPVVLARVEAMIKDSQLNIGCHSGLSYIYQAEERLFFDGKGREFISRCNITGEVNKNITSCNGVYINALNN